MTTLTREEKYELEVLKQFCDLICDGSWTEGGTAWQVREESADKAFALLDELEERMGR